MMCRCLKVSRSGYYAWLGREPSRTVRRRKELSALNEWVLNSSHGTYGYRRVHAALARRGVETSPDTVRSVMREQGLEAAQPRRKDPAPPSPPRTWARAPTWSGGTPAAGQPGEQVGGRHPPVSAPGEEGSICLATAPGCCTKKAVGYAIGATARGTDSVVRGDRYGGPQVPAHDRRDDLPLGPGVPVHLRAALPASGRYEIIASTGRTGVCWDNAWAEVGGRHPQGTKEPTPMVYPARSKAIRDTASQVKPGTHDQKRLHSALGYRTPNEVEEKYRATRRAA